jgi:glutamyl-tRNA synthetase
VKPSRGRWAPSPTGETHLGTARTALVAWLDARSSGGSLIWRIEDLDGPRVVAGAAERQLDDLAWLGLDWDEGPDRGGPHTPYRQSERSHLYVEAIAHLAGSGRLFPCRRSRKELEAIASAPHGAEAIPYPPSLRPARLADGWLDDHRAQGRGIASLRFRVDEQPVEVVDRILGTWTERVDLEVGDFVVERRDGLFAYQLAVVADDLAMGVDSVVRGADLAASTARQLQLMAALGGEAPRYAHVPLVLNTSGEKLSKRDAPPSLSALREAGTAPNRLVGILAWSLGLLPEPAPCSPGELVSRFAWERVIPRPWIVPDELAAWLQGAAGSKPQDVPMFG